MKTTITCPQKMASVSEPSTSKRPHIKTERMQEFIKSHGEVSNQKQFRCPHEGCTKVFTTQPGLRYHKKTHETWQDPVEYKCPQCFRTFKSSNGLKYHRACRGKTRCEDGPPVNTGQKPEVQDDQQPSSTVTQLFQSHDLEEEVKVIDHVEETSGVCALSDTAAVTVDEEKERKGALLLSSNVDNTCNTELKQGFNKKQLKKIPPKLNFPFAGAQTNYTMQSLENRFTDTIKVSSVHSEEYPHFTSLQTSAPHEDHPLLDRSGREYTELKPLLPSRPCYQHYHDNMDRKLIEDAGKLTEFAHFATSPQSPLMQTIMPWDKPTGPVVRSLNKSLDDCSPEPYKHCSKLYESVTMETTENIQHGLDLKADNCRHINMNAADYLCEPDCMMDTNGNYFSDGSDPRVTSSSPFPVSPKDLSNPDGTWSHKWPTAIWQCFIADTQIYFVGEGEGEWHRVECLAKREVLAQQAARHDTYHTQRYAENGLKLMSIQCCHDGDGSSIKLFFTPDLREQSDLWALCEVDHPFYVRDKGWCSHNQMLTAERYGIPCNKLEVGDVCLGPKHPDETFSNLSSDNATPSYEAAVYTLSSMAQQRNQRDVEQSPKSNNQNSPSKKRQLKLEPLKAKRPMNAFMLFAKEYRLEYTQKFPGKDNRAISVMLGDKWKKMSTDDRNVYAEKAKVLADHQKKIHPDCWKRKK